MNNNIKLHLLPGVAQVKLLGCQADAVGESLQVPVHPGSEGFEEREEGEDEVVLLVRGELLEVGDPDHVVQGWRSRLESFGPRRPVSLTQRSGTAVQVVEAAELCNVVANLFNIFCLQYLVWFGSI